MAVAAKRCLVVDDSRAVRRIARKLLEGMLFQISEAEDGQKALDACRREMPDAVLLDQNMPRMNGIEFLRALRRERAGAMPVVIFCTTENDATAIALALQTGAREYIMKPFDESILISKFTHAGLLGTAL